MLIFYPIEIGLITHFLFTHLLNITTLLIIKYDILPIKNPSPKHTQTQYKNNLLIKSCFIQIFINFGET